ARRWLLVFSFTLLPAFVAPRFSAPRAYAQQVATQPSATPAAATPANPPQAYTLPPEKLAKAIALSRIRNTLRFASAIWGLLACWILLATRTYARIAGWAERILKRRWLSG